MSDPKTQTEILLAEVWQRSLPLLIQRLDLLDRAAAAASSGSISEEQREEAANIAHKLAGSLGMFGRHRGTEIGRELEVLFRCLPPSQPDQITPLTRELRQTTLS